MLLEEGYEFLFKTHSLVVFLLILNVSDNLGDAGPAHAKSSIPFLPRKFSAELICPFRRICLDRSHRLSQRQDWRHLNQQMNVVLHSTNGVDEDLFVFADASDIRPHSWLKLFFYQPLALFRAEHHMHYVLRVCVRQMCHPSGVRILNRKPYPALTRWANL